VHIHALKNHLTTLYGEPTVLERQNAYRWQIDSLGPMAVYICLTIEELTRRASVWIFDPNRQVDHTYYFEVDDTVDLEAAMNQMRQRLPAPSG